jgi:predicted small integral membrane protein
VLAIRLAKIACIATLALDVALVAFDNVTDYWTNFAFVAHVLDMDDIPPASHLRWRAINSPLLHHMTYILIIMTEIIIAALGAVGAMAMLRALRAKGQNFHKAKKAAVVGLSLGFLLYEGAFIVVGGEWFSMWQARDFDAVGSASRIAMAMLATLIFISIKDEDLA